MGVGKVPGETERELQASLKGNHDNLVSGTHQAPSHWEVQWRNAQILIKTNIQRGGEAGGKKKLELLHMKATWVKWLTSAKVL